MANNETIKILNGDKIVVNVNTFRHFINELIDRRIKGKGLSTNDFTNEDKTKLTSALTSTSIISAGKVSGDLSNSKINLNNIFTERFPGDTRTYGVIPGANVSGTLTNAIMEGSKVSGELTNANIDIERVNNLNDIIRNYSDGTFMVDANKVRGNLTNATIGIERVNRITDVITIIGGSIAQYQVKANKVYGNLDNATIRGSSIIGSIDASRIQGNLANAEIQSSNITGYIDVSKLQDTINDVVIVGKINAANISGGFLDNVLIPASTIHGELTNATIKTVNIEGNIPGNKIGGTISGSIITGTLTNADILFDNLVMGSTKLQGKYITGNVDASLIHGKLTNATIDSSNIKGTITAEEILADYSITSTHLATGAVLPENIASGNLASGVKVNVNTLVGYIPAGRLQGNIDKERMRSGFLELCEEYKVVRNNTLYGTD